MACRPPFAGSGAFRRCEAPPSAEEAALGKKRRFFHAIAKNPRFGVRQGKLAARGGEHGIPVSYGQKHVELRMGMDIATVTRKNAEVQQILLVTGDSDLVPAIECAKVEAKTVCLFRGPGKHGDTIRAGDDHFGFDRTLRQSLALE